MGNCLSSSEEGPNTVAQYSSPAAKYTPNGSTQEEQQPKGAQEPSAVPQPTVPPPAPSTPPLQPVTPIDEVCACVGLGLGLLEV